MDPSISLYCPGVNQIIPEGLKNIGLHSKSGRPLHTGWEGFRRVTLPDGRTAAKCENCPAYRLNTSKGRLEMHRNRCFGDKARVIESQWSEPAPELSEDWQGFLISSAVNTLGGYNAKCKNCRATMEGKVEYLGKHKEVCGQFTVEEYLEDSLHEEEVVVEVEEVVLPSKRRQPNVVQPSTQNYAMTGRDRSFSADDDGQSYTKRTSRFADISRVWERKLDDLPLEQALEIEKKMSDMLYEAQMASLQARKTPSGTSL